MGLRRLQGAAEGRSLGYGRQPATHISVSGYPESVYANNTGEMTALPGLLTEIKEKLRMRALLQQVL